MARSLIRLPRSPLWSIACRATDLTAPLYQYHHHCSGRIFRLRIAPATPNSSTTVCSQLAKHVRHLLRPFAYLPVEEPELAGKIAADLDGQWAGAVAGTELGRLCYASDRYDGLWQTLSDKGLPLFIHPGSSPDQRLDSFYLSNLLGNPVETTIAATNLVFAGVMHRFPGLKVILAHGGGCVAALCGRWQQGVATERPGIPPLALEPRHAIRRFFVDSLVHSPAYLAAIIQIVGDERVLLGSDWPFPMGTASADHDLGHLSHAQKIKLRKTNAEQVFGGRLTY